MRTFLSLLGFALLINVVFAGLTYLFFRGQIRGAKTFVDYLHYAIGSLTTSEVAGMIPETSGAKLWTSMYILTAWVFFIYLAIHHFTSIRIGI
jgi:hypothetical protein